MSAAASAFTEVLLLGGVPFFGYWLWQRHCNNRTFAETARRAGLQVGRPRYLIYSLLFAAAACVALMVWPPPIEPLIREGSIYRQFAGLGLSGRAIVMSLLHGVVRTGFSEELLFRGLIAGSLSRRLPLIWANLAQALLFVIPHLGILFVARQTFVWGILPLVFAVALIFGWVRIHSGSILGPWLIHAFSNVTMALLVASLSPQLMGLHGGCPNGGKTSCLLQ